MRKSAPRHSGHRIPEPWWCHGVTGLQVATRLPWLPSQARPSHVTSPQAKPSQAKPNPYFMPDCVESWEAQSILGRQMPQVYSGFTPLTGGPTYCRETHVHNSHPRIEGYCLFYHMHYGASMLNLISQRNPPSNPNQVHNGDQRLHPLH